MAEAEIMDAPIWSDRTILVRNRAHDAPSAFSDDTKPTIVVMGTRRSGTTMAAGLLQILGVEFGDHVADRAEDVAIKDTLQRLRGGIAMWNVFGVRRRLRKQIAERRAQYGVFGFKSPFLGPALWALARDIPNPYFVIALRNPAGVARSASRWGPSQWTDEIVPAALLQLFYVRFAVRTRAPVLLFSFEDGVSDGEALLDGFARFLGVPVTGEMRLQARAFVNPKVGYRTTRRLQGWVETLEPTRVRGWVADLADPSRTLSIEAWLGDTLLSRASANRPREDVQAAGLHTTGACGFDLTFDTPLGESEQAALTLTVPELRHVLRFRLDAENRSMYVPQAHRPVPMAS